MMNGTTAPVPACTPSSEPGRCLSNIPMLEELQRDARELLEKYEARREGVGVFWFGATVAEIDRWIQNGGEMP